MLSEDAETPPATPSMCNSSHACGKRINSHPRRYQQLLLLLLLPIHARTCDVDHEQAEQLCLWQTPRHADVDNCTFFLKRSSNMTTIFLIHQHLLLLPPLPPSLLAPVMYIMSMLSSHACHNCLQMLTVKSS
jgi:hypothetical protein